MADRDVSMTQAPSSDSTMENPLKRRKKVQVSVVLEGPNEVDPPGRNADEGPKLGSEVAKVDQESKDAILAIMEMEDSYPTEEAEAMVHIELQPVSGSVEVDLSEAVTDAVLNPGSEAAMVDLESKDAILAMQDEPVPDNFPTEEADPMVQIKLQQVNESEGIYYIIADSPHSTAESSSRPASQDARPRSPTPPPEGNGPTTIISIHRSSIQTDLIAVFMDPSIIYVQIKVRFIDESGAEGVSRDAYSGFWNEFFLTSSCGEQERVPLIFPEYGRDEWQAVGRILLQGYIDCGIYPLQLSQAFSMAMIHGELSMSSDMLIESFRMYLCNDDRKVVDHALAGETLDESEESDFLQLLSRVDCHSNPDQEGIRRAILSVAHKELIQEPKYALDEMARSASEGLQVLLPDVETIQMMYDSKKPTAKKVLKLLECTPQDKEQDSDLKQCIKGLDEGMLKKFLRHFTGAESSWYCEDHMISWQF